MVSSTGAIPFPRSLFFSPERRRNVRQDEGSLDEKVLGLDKGKINVFPDRQAQRGDEAVMAALQRGVHANNPP